MKKIGEGGNQKKGCSQGSGNRGRGKAFCENLKNSDALIIGGVREERDPRACRSGVEGGAAQKIESWLSTKKKRKHKGEKKLKDQGRRVPTVRKRCLTEDEIRRRGVFAPH